MIKLIVIILLCFAAVMIIVIFDARPSHPQEEILVNLKSHEPTADTR